MGIVLTGHYWATRSINSVQSLFRILLAIIVNYCVLPCNAQDNLNNDVVGKTVLLTVGEVDLNIPLGFFFERTVWNGGRWPEPKPTRSVDKRPVILVAYIDGMRAWSPALDADFKSGGVKTTRILIRGDYNNNWLKNSIRALPALEVIDSWNTLPDLVAYTGYPSSPKSEVIFLRSSVPQKPYFEIRCSRLSPVLKCSVMFDYRENLVVSYSLPVALLANWKLIHSDVLRLLNSF